MSTDDYTFTNVIFFMLIQEQGNTKVGYLLICFSCTWSTDFHDRRWVEDVLCSVNRHLAEWPDSLCSFVMLK